MGLWTRQQERRQQLIMQTPTPSWPPDILQKCHLSSPADICKQLVTFRGRITRVKILGVLIHENKWRFMLIGKVILRSKQASHSPIEHLMRTVQFKRENHCNFKTYPISLKHLAIEAKITKLLMYRDLVCSNNCKDNPLLNKKKPHNSASVEYCWYSTHLCQKQR